MTVHTTKGDKTIVYKRTAYSKNVATGEIDSGTNSEKIKYLSSMNDYFIEKLSVEEEVSVNDNGGYYIGRFEAGDEESTKAKTMRTSTSSLTNTVAIKKNQSPYNYMYVSYAKKLAEGMAVSRGYEAKTKLISSYAWDTAISLIQITNEDYGNISEGENCRGSSFSYIDIKGVEKTKEKDSYTIVPTGQTASVCNIYDLGGNLEEFTSESDGFILGGTPYTKRGSSFSSSTCIPGLRNYSRNGSTNSNEGFRVTLFL